VSIAKDHVAEVAICCQQKGRLSNCPVEYCQVGDARRLGSNRYDYMPILTQPSNDWSPYAFIGQNVHGAIWRTRRTA